METSFNHANETDIYIGDSRIPFTGQLLQDFKNTFLTELTYKAIAEKNARKPVTSVNRISHYGSTIKAMAKLIDSLSIKSVIKKLDEIEIIHSTGSMSFDFKNVDELQRYFKNKENAKLLSI